MISSIDSDALNQHLDVVAHVDRLWTGDDGAFARERVGRERHVAPETKH